MRLNLGCGNIKIDGFLNVDVSEVCKPDMVLDLEKTPWPWKDSVVEEVRLIHVLEHLGADTNIFLNIMKELYRVCKDNAKITIHVPHPRHDVYLIDPTHVRPILPETLELFSKAKCTEWQSNEMATTPLALYLDVDFEITKVEMELDPDWKITAQDKKLTQADIIQAITRYNNVVSEVMMELIANKPC